jgi:hypothetical protein
MLTKALGATQNVSLSGSTQVVYVKSNLFVNMNGVLGNIPVNAVRISTGTQPAFVSFNTPYSSSTSILIPANYAEDFKFDIITTSTISTTFPYQGRTITSALTSTVTVMQAGTGGVISITPIGSGSELETITSTVVSGSAGTLSFPFIIVNM